jgi:hypothetical protein
MDGTLSIFNAIDDSAIKGFKFMPLFKHCRQHRLKKKFLNRTKTTSKQSKNIKFKKSS